jgi:predicted RecA/RadA family phage recombinase
MAIATYVQSGDSVDYTPSTAVAAGDVVVQGDLVGVATMPIAANALGALAVSGIFDFPKATGEGTAIDAGALVYWDATTSVATTDDNSGGNKLIGKAVLAAVDDDDKVRVRLSQ